MNLKQYNDLCVRISDFEGEYAEGACTYNSREYNRDEYGRDEDALQIANYLFFESDIAGVEVINEENPFREPYGVIEREALEDGPDTIDDLLFCDEPRNIMRMLACLEDHYLKLDFPYREEVHAMLVKLQDWADDEAVKAKVKDMLAKKEE